MVVIPIFLIVVMSTVVTGIWIVSLRILRDSSGFEFGVALFVLAADGVFVPAMMGFLMIYTLLDEWRSR